MYSGRGRILQLLESLFRAERSRGKKNPITSTFSALNSPTIIIDWKYLGLQEELPKDDVEKLLRQAGGKKSLIDCLHVITAMDQKYKERKAASEAASAASVDNTVEEAEKKKWEKPFPSPDGIPKTREELDEDENGLMPDSPFTRLLRSKGNHPAWYSEVPDHETD